MRHEYQLSDIESLVVLDGLNMLISNVHKNDTDKRIANEIKEMILDTVVKDKRK